MAKEGKSFSRLMLQAGELLLFRPRKSFSASSQEEKPPVGRSLLPYKRKIKSALAKMAEQSFFLGLVRFMVRRILATRMRALGIFCFLCGFLQVLAFFLGDYLPFFSGKEENLLFGVAFIFLTMIFSFSRGDLRGALSRSFLLRGLLQPLLGVEDKKEPEETGRERVWTMILSGVATGALCVVFSPGWVLVGIALFSAVLLLFSKPETGFFLSVLLLFFAPYWMVAPLLVLSLLSYLLKCSVGRRCLVFRFSDPAVLLAVIPVATVSGRNPFFLALALFAGYFLTSALYRNSETLKRFYTVISVALILGSLSVCLRSVFLALVPDLFLRFPGAAGWFLTPTAENCVLFAALIPLAMGRMRYAGRGFRGLSVLVVLLGFAAVFLAKDFRIWLALAAGLAVYALLRHRAALLAAMAVLPTLALIWSFLPESLALRILSYFGVENSFFSATGAESLLTGLLHSSGYAGCFLFLWTVGFFLYACFRLTRVGSRSDVYALVLGSISSVTVLICLSFMAIPFDFRLSILYFCMMAVPSAAEHVCRREEVRAQY